jgi:DNA polymerase-3 subunit gamma/tau
VALDWAELVEQVEHHAPLVGSSMRLSVRVIELRAGYLRYQLAPGLPGDPSADIRKALQHATGEPWQVERDDAVSSGEAQPSRGNQAGSSAAGPSGHAGRPAGQGRVRRVSRREDHR